MKLLAIPAILLLSLFASAQAKWDGGGSDGLWENPMNWETDVVPAATDDVLLDNSLLSGNYTVTLPTGAITTSVNSLTITPSGVNNIRLIIPAGNTENSGLNVTGPGDALILDNGAILQNSSGTSSPGAGIAIANTFRINNGGHYIHNTTADNSSIVSQLSAVSGTETGIFEYDIPVTSSYEIAAAGHTYGTLILTAVASGNSNYTISSGSYPLSVFIQGDFLVNSNANLVNATGINIVVDGDFETKSASSVDLSPISASLVTLSIKGDFSVAGTITETGTGAPKITLNGSSNQNITVAGTGSITGDQLNFTLDNAAGATLLSDLTLPYNYTIKAGNLTLGNFSLSTTYVAQSSGAPLTNHIITNGTGFLTIRNITTAVVEFPVGINATSLNKVSIVDGGGLDYSVRVVSGIVPTISNPFIAVDRTWIINSSGPLPTSPYPAITFYYYTGDGQPGFDYNANVDVGEHFPGAWSIVAANAQKYFNAVNNEYRAAPLAGKITSLNSPFVIGNNGAILTLDFFITCNTQKNGETGVVKWSIANDQNVTLFEVEKAEDNSSFRTIASFKPNSGQLEYIFTDNNLSAAANLYRIKTILADGKIKYSNTAAIIHKSRQFLITSVSPNPVQTTTSITISSPVRTVLRMVLYDIQGRVIKQWQYSLIEGTSTMMMQADNLRSGVYFLSGTDGNGKTNQVRIVKQ